MARARIVGANCGFNFWIEPVQSVRRHRETRLLHLRVFVLRGSVYPFRRASRLFSRLHKTVEDLVRRASPAQAPRSAQKADRYWQIRSGRSFSKTGSAFGGRPYPPGSTSVLARRVACLTK